MEPKKFVRSKNSFICGVCAGLAEYVSMPVWLMRGIWIVFAIVSWFWLAVIAYVVLAFVMSQPEGAPEGDRFWHHMQGRNVMVVLAVVLICMGAFIIFQQFFNIYLQKYLFPVALIVGGALLMAFAFGRNNGKVK